MLLPLVLGLVLGAVGVVFALENTFLVTVSFLGWEISSSLAVIVILSILLGAMAAILMTLPGAIKTYFTISGLKRENKKLAKDVVHAQKMDAISPVPPASQPPQE
jgi:lipopolysaccharide assembly protein A